MLLGRKEKFRFQKGVDINCMHEFELMEWSKLFGICRFVMPHLIQTSVKDLRY